MSVAKTAGKKAVPKEPWSVAWMACPLVEQTEHWMVAMKAVHLVVAKVGGLAASKVDWWVADWAVLKVGLRVAPSAGDWVACSVEMWVDWRVAWWDFWMVAKKAVQMAV